MKPVMQTKVSNAEGTVHGNCFAACVASLLELNIDDVPAFETSVNGEWYLWLWELLQQHGYEGHGCRYFGSRDEGGLSAWPEDTTDYEPLGPGVDGYYIVGGASPRGFKRGHCVLYKEGQMSHDPHPSGAGLADLQEVYLIERQAVEPASEASR